jgi:uncharacterized membrane protein
MLAFTAWYLLITAAGALSLPLAWRLLPALPDRGYSLSRTLGLLLWGYFFWALASLGVLRNEPGSLVFALAIVATLSGLALRGKTDELTAWLRANLRQVIFTEVLFLAAFGALAFLRSANPEILGTEKPMELAFINAILRSPTFPPHDPWLSGYAISYYYFGYVMVAMLAMLTGVAGGVAFNLGIALVFALSTLGIFGLVYNLLMARARLVPGFLSPLRAAFLALFAPLLTLLMGNLEGFLHMLHNAGLFWSAGPDGALTSPFWSWLDIQDLKVPPVAPLSLVPDKYYWWWRASRVVSDYDLAGNYKEIIDEFPYFSFLLADLHPHVLAMPFAFLGMGLALNLFLGGGGQAIQARLGAGVRRLGWVGLIGLLGGIAIGWTGVAAGSAGLSAVGALLLAVGLASAFAIRTPLREYGASLLRRADQGRVEGDFVLGFSLPTFLLGAVALGGLSFLNTWDFPVAVGLFAGAYAFGRRFDPQGGFQPVKPLEMLKDFLLCGLLMGAAGGILYLPFYAGFSSQAGGALPNLIYATRGAHLWVMFATLLIPIFAFLTWLVGGSPLRRNFRAGSTLTFEIIVGLLVLSLAFGFGITLIPGLGDFFLGALAAPDRATLFSQAILRRLTNPGGWLTLTAALFLVLSVLARLIFNRVRLQADTDEALPAPRNAILPADAFVVLLILLATLLALIPEFFYLRDQFGWRINTIFKFYYQAWLLWGAAAAYGAIVLGRELGPKAGIAFRIGMAVVILAGLAYPIFATLSKTNRFNPGENGYTLDGTAYFERQSPDDLAAARALNQAPFGVVAEAVAQGGGSYTGYARISMLSGLPGVLGWIGHESQWRGGYAEMGSRQTDLARLYCSRDWNEAAPFIRKYNIRYIVVGGLEQEAYQPGSEGCAGGLNPAKFEASLKTFFRQGGIVIYEVPGGGQTDTP